ncbi:neurofilament heavy polypeptide-like [Macrobrachium rosenbergii]|uniref:neurofilament heavy polypeptide-like n=1 Tax=Macrobrachium rosenbergii TaxID=79674 RepID=UPI0034D76BA0
MVSPRKRSLVVRQMRSGPKTLSDSPEDWVSGSSFHFKESPVISKRVESRRSNAFRRPPQATSPKKRRQSMILKRLDLPSGSVVISPASSRRRTRRQSMAVMTSKVTLASVPEGTKSKVPQKVFSKSDKSNQGKKSPKRDTPKKTEPQKITGSPERKLQCSVSLTPLEFSISPGKKGKESSQKSSLQLSSLKRKVDLETTNKVDSPAKRLKSGLSEVSKETKRNSPTNKGKSVSAQSPSFGKRKLRSEIPLKVDTSSKSKRIATKNVSTPKSPSSLTGKLKSLEGKETNKNVVKSPKEGKSPKQDKISVKSKQKVSKEEKSPKLDKVSATKSKQTASPKEGKSPRLDKISPKLKQKVVSVKKSPLSSKKSTSPKMNSPEEKTKLTLKKSPRATSEKKEVSSYSTKNEKLDKGKKMETSKSSPKVLTSPKLHKASLVVKKTGLSPASPKLRTSQVNSGDPSPSGKLDKIKKTKTPRPDRKVALSSPKASVRQKSTERKDESGASPSKTPQIKNKSPASKQEKVEKSVPLKKKAVSSPKVTPPQKQKKANLSSKDTKSSKKKTISGDTPDKKVKIKTPLSIRRLDSPLGGSVRLTRSSRRVTLVGKSPRGPSFKKTPKSKKQSPPKEKITDIGASPIFSARTQLNLIRCSSPLGRRVHKSPSTKVKPFTPKPDSPPSNVLRKTMKKNVAQRMHATTKVEIHQLMNGEISKPVTLVSGKKFVAESVTVTQTKIGGLNIAVTPRKALSSDFTDGTFKTTVNAATPASASNLPPTPTSSRKQSEPLRSVIANSESRISCRQSLLMSMPRSSTPIEDDDSLKPPSVDTIIEKETNFTDDSIDTDQSEDEESVMEDKKKDATPEKPKRSYCSLM